MMNQQLSQMFRDNIRFHKYAWIVRRCKASLVSY